MPLNVVPPIERNNKLGLKCHDCYLNGSIDGVDTNDVPEVLVLLGVVHGPDADDDLHVFIVCSKLGACPPRRSRRHSHGIMHVLLE